MRQIKPFIYFGAKKVTDIGINWNFAESYEHVKNVVVDYPISKFKKKGLYIFGNAIYPPIISNKVLGYILWYNKSNFLGKESISAFNGLNCELVFEISKQDQFQNAVDDAHAIVLEGYVDKVTLLFNSANAFDKKMVRSAAVDDFQLVIKSSPGKNYQNCPTDFIGNCSII